MEYLKKKTKLYIPAEIVFSEDYKERIGVPVKMQFKDIYEMRDFDDLWEFLGYIKCEPELTMRLVTRLADMPQEVFNQALLHDQECGDTSALLIKKLSRKQESLDETQV